jgi:hypothetical protein
MIGAAMRSLISSLFVIVWGLWFGGMIMLFIAVMRMFAVDPSRELAIRANPVLFHVFERYQLVLAGIALVLIFAWILLRRSGVKIAMFVVLVIASLAASVSSVWITPRIDRLQAEQRTRTPEFRRAHGQSMGVYTLSALMLLVSGMLLPVAIRTDRTAEAAARDD